jgi:uncharacterized membrane protein YgcG
MITINDRAGVLDTNQMQDLRAANASSHVVVNLVNVGSAMELDTLTQSCVTTPNTLCIGRDNAHKWTSVHPGIDLGIKGDAAVEVRKAGNADFRQGDVVGGLKAIVSRSEAVRMKQNQTAVIVEHQVVRHETAYWPLFVVGGGLIAIVVFFVLKAKRSAKKAEDAMRVAQGEAAEAVSRNIEAGKDDDLNRRFRQLDRSVKADNPDFGSGSTVAAARSPEPRRHATPVAVAAPAPMPAMSPSRVVVHHHHHHTPAPVVVNSGPDFVDGMILGEALSHRESRHVPDYYPIPDYDPPRRRERTPEPVRREPTPEPVHSSSFSWGGGLSSDNDSSSSSFGGGSTSDDDNSSSSSDSNVGSDSD